MTEDLLSDARKAWKLGRPDWEEAFPYDYSA